MAQTRGGGSHTLNKIASKSRLKGLKIEKETFSIENDALSTCKSPNEYLSGSHFPLQKQNRSIEAARTLGHINRFCMQQQQLPK